MKQGSEFPPAPADPRQSLRVPSGVACPFFPRRKNKAAGSVCVKRPFLGASQHVEDDRGRGHALDEDFVEELSLSVAGGQA